MAMATLRGRDRGYPSLSGGEAAWLAPARLILLENSVVVLDEPTNHLDVEVKRVGSRATDGDWTLDHDIAGQRRRAGELAGLDVGLGGVFEVRVGVVVAGEILAADADIERDARPRALRVVEARELAVDAFRGGGRAGAGSAGSGVGDRALAINHLPLRERGARTAHVTRFLDAPRRRVDPGETRRITATALPARGGRRAGDTLGRLERRRVRGSGV